MLQKKVTDEGPFIFMFQNNNQMARRANGDRVQPRHHRGSEFLPHHPEVLTLLTSPTTQGAASAAPAWVWPGVWPTGRRAACFPVALTFLGLTCVTFFIGRVIPIDPVLAIVGDKASAETYARVRAEIGLDLPLPVQYWRYLMKVLHGDFGNSVITSRPVLQDLLQVFPATLELATLAMLIGVVVGVPMGVLGRHPSRPLAGPGDPLSSACSAIPCRCSGSASSACWCSTPGSAGSAGPGRLDVASTTTSSTRSPA